MDYDWKDTFHYTQRERRGIFILATILIALLLARFHIKTRLPTPTDFSSFKEEIALFEQERLSNQQAIAEISTIPAFPFNPNVVTKKELLQLGIKAHIADRIIKYREKGGQFRKKKDLQKIYGLPVATFEKLVPFIVLPSKQVIHTKLPTTKKRLRPFRFNPNEVSVEELIRMGLTQKTAQQILNYRNKGGQFRKKEDLKKMYSLSTAQYQQLAPFILISTPKIKRPKPPVDFPKTPPKSYATRTPIKVDVNKATVVEWQQLYGIGPYYAKKIVAFREKLGGFVSIQQIKNTYNLPDSVFQKIHPHLIYSPIFRTIPINTTPLDALIQHPLLRAYQAKAIINYRINHGPYKDWKAIQQVKILSEEQLEQLKPYLSFAP